MKKLFNSIMICVLLFSSTFIGTACSDDDKNGSNKYPVPVISEFSPSEGLPTSVVTIKGANFGTERTERVGRVYFGGVEATDYESWSDNEIKVRVPQKGITGNITLWVWKNHTETTDEFICVPGAEITSINPSPTFPGSQITINGKNFQYFIDKGVTAQDVIVEFCAEEGITKATADALTATSVTVTVPTDAKGGVITIDFDGYQKVSGPELPLVGDLNLPLINYLETSGTITIEEGGIGSTKDGAYVIYQFDAPATGLFDVYLMTGTTKDGSSLNVNIGDNLNTLKTAALNETLTHAMKNTGSWATNWKDQWGAFYLEEGKTYYLKITFLQVGTTWVGNVGEIGLTLSADQNQTPVNGVKPGVDYVIYKHDFNSGTSYLPFTDAWAWEPNYIKIVDKYLEFYYNYKALLEDDRRMRRGAEVTCNFKTTTEGWYGFKVYLPEGKFPMNESGIIIAQIFGQGCKNSWAGHLSIDQGILKLSHRHALIDPVVGIVGKLETNKWYSVVVYFKAGRNNKGHLKAWIGDNMVEGSPAYDSGNCNFGFAHWIDDDTLDDTGNNSECVGYNGTYDALGCKFGLYVTNKVDMTIRFDDLKALEGNPAGAFDIVKPGK